MAASSPASSVKELRESRLLLTEGIEDQVFFREMLRKLSIGGIQVEQYEGKNKLRAFLDTLKLLSGFDRLGTIAIARDADANAHTAFQSVCTALSNTDLPFPAQPGEFAPGPPRVGVLILPPGQPHGMLEDVCLAAAQADPAMLCVDEFLRCVREKANRQPGNLAKARVHAWLASQLDPDKRLGEAAQAGYWPWGSPAFGPLKEFLGRLAHGQGS